MAKAIQSALIESKNVKVVANSHLTVHNKGLLIKNSFEIAKKQEKHLINFYKFALKCPHVAHSSQQIHIFLIRVKFPLQKMNNLQIANCSIILAFSVLHSFSIFL